MVDDLKIENLMREEEVQLSHLNKLIEDAVREENLLTRKIAEAEADQEMTPGQRWADMIARLGGSWRFITFFFIFLAIWIAANSVIFFAHPADPYPYIFLNLILSCLAAIQAPLIMMSQNRQEEKDRRRSRNDYMVNLKAEMEIRNLNNKMNLLLSEHMVSLFRFQQIQVAHLESIRKELEQRATR